jgi:hypothetical protein
MSTTALSKNKVCHICSGVLVSRHNKLDVETDARIDVPDSVKEYVGEDLFAHHENLHSLKISATSGCWICSEVWQNHTEAEWGTLFPAQSGEGQIANTGLAKGITSAPLGPITVMALWKTNLQERQLYVWVVRNRGFLETKDFDLIEVSGASLMSGIPWKLGLTT